MKELENNKYRIIAGIAIFILLSYFYYNWSESKDFRSIYVDIYPEIAGAILIFFLLLIEKKLILKDNKTAEIITLEEQIVSQNASTFWSNLIHNETDVYIGRDKQSQELSWTDIRALDLFRKAIVEQNSLRLMDLNELDTSKNYSNTNIISIGGPKRNNVSKVIFEKISSLIRFKIESDVTNPDIFYITRPNEIIKPSNNLDFAVFYYSKQNNSSWLVFSGLTRYSTIGAIEALLDDKIIEAIQLSMRSDTTFLEAIISFEIFGVLRINPTIVNIHAE